MNPEVWVINLRHSNIAPKNVSQVAHGAPTLGYLEPRMGHLEPCLETTNNTQSWYKDDFILFHYIPVVDRFKHYT